MDRETREHLRERFRPNEVRLLLIGESPPYGGTFFYNGDSILFEHTRAAFEQAFDAVPSGDDGFLLYFSGLGCYLDDLCPNPVNHLKSGTLEQRRAYREALREGVPLLAERMRLYRPSAVVGVVSSVAEKIGKAVALAGVKPERVEHLPFPTRMR